MEKITKIKHNNTNNNRKNQTSVVLVAVLFALAIAVVAGPTLVITIQEAHARMSGGPGCSGCHPLPSPPPSPDGGTGK